MIREEVMERLHQRRHVCPFVHRALTMHDIGTVDLETALASCVVALSESHEKLHKSHVDTLMRAPILVPPMGSTPLKEYPAPPRDRPWWRFW